MSKTALPWPKLSETLRFERHPHCCQACGNGPETGADLVAWVECDDHDRPTRTVVLLCDKCSRRLIETHPRLYDRQPKNKPLLGAMELCVECRHRKGLDCQHQDARANGGPGLPLKVADPTRGFWDGRDPETGRRTGGMMEIWPSPASECRGREAA